ncbi:hypothetical protein L3Q82_010936 [Scortum barcoo]|uniref:Uncharacterized protein n=1 Tax=Scortum barcoo TaxID=214431 RepID=A0ACB8W7U4_9TELE|nr:hypothetical protein L3Q82_010936 [Scortum barcoo]
MSNSGLVCCRDVTDLISWLANTYVRMLFVDFSSAFNTVIPDKLILKLHNLGLPSSLCHWIRDFLTNRPQVVRIGGQRILYTGPEHRHTTGLRAQLSPALFTLFTSDCSAIHSTNTIVKFADDTTIVREETQQLTQWCSNNNLVLNTSKIQGDHSELQEVQEGRACSYPHPRGSSSSCQQSIKFLGIHITSDLTWSMNTALTWQCEPSSCSGRTEIEQPLAKAPDPIYSCGAPPTEYHGKRLNAFSRSTKHMWTGWANSHKPSSTLRGYRGGPVFHDRDENHTVPPESKGRL